MRIRIATSIAAVLLALVAMPAAALGQDRAPDASAPAAVELGAPPPTGFELRSIDGDTYRLADILGERPVLLIFFRGTW